MNLSNSEKRDIIKLIENDSLEEILLVDGYYKSIPSPWHKEILLALEKGIKVTGISSLGALRANDLKDFVESSSRNEANILRDVYRNPFETLSFFGLESDMTVVELSPGGGWYTEILAPYLRTNGKLSVTHHNPDAGGYYMRSRNSFDKKLASNRLFEGVKVITADVPPSNAFTEPESQDLVVTFRNLHNWL